MNPWAQFYTPQSAGQLLVSAMHSKQADTVVDIGVGSGQLLRAARARWQDARLYAADIDHQHVEAARNCFPEAVCRKLDALRICLPAKLGLEEGQADVAVCNPPYLPVTDLPEIHDILRAADLHDCFSAKRVTTEIIFIAQNLRLLRPGGELAVIVPDGLATHSHYAELRQALCERHGLYRVIQLPDRFFAGTEARTHIFYLRKQGKPVSTIRLVGATPNGDLAEEVAIVPDSARTRLDYSFYAHAVSAPLATITLRDLGAEIVRGMFTHQECRKQAFPFFHTTDFKRFPDGRVIYPGHVDYPERWGARAGDILVPRVGARCLHYTAKVVSGQPVFTDCVYRIRVEARWRQAVWNALSSEAGRNWRIQAAHGVCARVLGKEVLLNFPTRVAE
ncbi:MAG: N-6 DNA methylase [Pseudomonadota bacterium]|nr:N-6 DNA methylase [Pseudomonadota bacterium]MDP1903872.1 N-6 DNA methylase [Pseudomonadota bacterium]MDP2353630.1 N-6 DNA methylase [Pseudomonadota bacterium]